MQNRLILGFLLSFSCLLSVGCSSGSATDLPEVTSSGAKAAASLTPGKSTVADLKMYVSGPLTVNEGTGGAAVYQYTENRPGPVKRVSIVGPIYNTSTPTTITTTHSFKFVNGVFVEYWASDSVPAQS